MSVPPASESVRPPVIWGMCGGSGSGKSTLVAMFVARLPPGTVSVLHADSYYRDMSSLPENVRAAANFDHPDSVDGELLATHMDALASGHAVDVPVYDFASHARLDRAERLEAAPIVLVEGILIFSFASVRERLAYSVFLDVPQAVRLERRIARDVVARGRTEESVRRQFAATVGPMHWEHVQPWAAHANRVVRHGADYEIVADELARTALAQLA